MYVAFKLSLKVIRCCANRRGIYDFLLVLALNSRPNLAFLSLLECLSLLEKINFD